MTPMTSVACAIAVVPVLAFVFLATCCVAKWVDDYRNRREYVRTSRRMDGEDMDREDMPKDSSQSVSVSTPSSMIRAEWEQFPTRHILPSRVFKLSFGMIQETEEDRQHLERCRCCRRAYDGYRSSKATETGEGMDGD